MFVYLQGLFLFVFSGAIAHFSEMANSPPSLLPMLAHSLDLKSKLTVVWVLITLVLSGLQMLMLCIIMRDMSGLRSFRTPELVLIADLKATGSFLRSV